MARFVSRISEIVRKVKPDGDPIMFSKQIQHVGQFMVEGCRTDAEIRALFQELNQLALQNEDAAINLAHILTSRFMETIKFQQSQTTVRNEVLRILQGNFANHQSYKADRLEKAYAALTLLGEFYNLIRISDQPIGILGQSLLQLLEQELQEVLHGKVTLGSNLAKLVSTQITLNGLLWKKHEGEKLNAFLDTVRRVIVEAEGKNSRRGKAYLLLGLDLYYSNFTANAMISLQKVYGPYTDETKINNCDPFEEESTRAATDAATNTSYHEDRLPEKRQRVEIAVQTEVASHDVFRAGPPIIPPIDRTLATTYTNLSMSQGETASKVTPSSPSATNSSGTRKSKIDPRIRNMKIGRVYPNPVGTSATSSKTPSPPRALSCVSTLDGASEVAKLSIKNVTLHELAMMKENPSHLNRITNGYLDRLAPPSEMRCPSIKSSSEYAGKENESDSRVDSVSDRGVERPRPRKDPSGSKKSPTSNGNGPKQGYRMEENFDTITYDPSFFDDYVPSNNHTKSFLQFLENK